MNVLLIDDHPLILAALQSVIEGFGEGVQVMGVDTARAARHTLTQNADYDLALLDLQLGDADGFELLAEMRSTYPALPVVVVSASDRVSDVIRAIDLGAMGFVPKRASNETLFEALHMVLSGGIYVPAMAMGMDRRPKAPSPVPAATAGIAPGPGPARGKATEAGGLVHPELSSFGLTPRQTEVLALLLQGKPNKLIARDLNVSVETVKDHVAAVLRALNVSSRTQAVLAVSQMAHQPGGLGLRRRS